MIIRRFLLLSLGILFIASCSPDDVEEGFFEYGGQKYKTVVINGQELMAENLNYNVPGSKCYNNDPANCATYGRLYNWVMAMAFPDVCIGFSCAERVNTPHKGICPDGWHIPTNAEWDKLYHYADGTDWVETLFYNPYNSPTAGRHLKAKIGWKHCGPSSSSSSGSSSSSSYDDKPYLCDDTFGFAALPGGYSRPEQNGFGEVGEVGFWWSASEYEGEVNSNSAYGRYMYNRFDTAKWNYNIKTYFYSVRCFKD